MAILTLAQVCSTATTIAGGRLDWVLSEASFYANQAIGYVARAAGVEHRSLESSYATSIGSGVSRMLLPADYNVPLAFSIGSRLTTNVIRWRTLGKRDAGWADVFAGNLDGGIPEAYVEYGNYFELVPSPNSTYSLTLRYRRQPESLVTSTATLSLEEQWHWAVVLKTAELLAMSRSDFEMEQLSRNRYIDYMMTLLPDQQKKLMDQRGALHPLPRTPSKETANL